MNSFTVKLGHCTVQVSAKDGAEAIAQARKFFCEDWPSHRDMIMSKHITEKSAQRACRRYSKNSEYIFEVAAM